MNGYQKPLDWLNTRILREQNLNKEGSCQKSTYYKCLAGIFLHTLTSLTLTRLKAREISCKI